MNRKLYHPLKSQILNVIKHVRIMKTILILLSSFLFFSLNIHAQDVAGVHVGSRMTKAQVIEKFGEPEEYDISDSYMDEEAKYEVYDYGHGNWLAFVDECLYDFYVRTSRWPVLLSMIEGGIEIGDPFSKLASLNPKPADWIDNSTYYIPCGDFPLLITVKDGIITGVSFEIKL